MPDPQALSPRIDPLIKAYRDAWRRTVAQQQALIRDPAQASKRHRLASMRQAIERDMQALDAQASRWIQRQLPTIYASGAESAAVRLPSPGPFAWNQVHLPAAQHLADGLYKDLLTATSNVNASTKALIRRIARDRLLEQVIRGETAQAAGRVMARLIAQHGISAVTYSNGARHGLASYSEMAIRTVSGTAYNEGTLRFSEENGVNWFECFDGTGCGFEYHDSPRQANGAVVSYEDSLAYPLSHPNCRRAYGPRPDVENRKQAREESRVGLNSQDRAQAEMQLKRGERDALRFVR